MIKYISKSNEMIILYLVMYILNCPRTNKDTYKPEKDILILLIRYSDRLRAGWPEFRFSVGTRDVYILYVAENASGAHLETSPMDKKGSFLHGG
jgi:hypothetical protein